MQPNQWKSISLTVTKTAVFVISCWYIYWVIDKNMMALKSFEIKNYVNLLGTAALAFFIYIILIMLLVRSWLLLLGDNHRVACARIYLQSQVIKYMPGNIFHFAFRHAETKCLGFQHSQLMKATISETTGLIIMALLTSSVLLLWPQHLSHLIDWLPDYTLFLLFASLLVLWAVIKHKNSQLTSAALLNYFGYFVGMGLMVFLLLSGLGFEHKSYLFLMACYAISWLCGYLIPGAPGGMGVREAVFILVTNPELNESEALLLIAAIRLISIIAEAIIFIAAKPLSQFYRARLISTDKTKQ